MKRKTVYWILTGLISSLFLLSAVGKLFPNEEAMTAAESIGLSTQTYAALGILEVIAVILFIIPRTGIIGFLLLACYMGGAIATVLEQGENIAFPAVIEASLWGIAFLRFPELRTRLLGRSSVKSHSIR
ncbi:MAG: DoxX family protein [Crocinitomicaceae bacterium]